MIVITQTKLLTFLSSKIKVQIHHKTILIAAHTPDNTGKIINKETRAVINSTITIVVEEVVVHVVEVKTPPLYKEDNTKANLTTRMYPNNNRLRLHNLCLNQFNIKDSITKFNSQDHNHSQLHSPMCNQSQHQPRSCPSVISII